MAILLNLLALALVVAIAWLGMMWLAGKVHSRDADGEQEWMITEVHPGDPCPECAGVGAKQRFGSLHPCPLCDGTGVHSGIS